MRAQLLAQLRNKGANRLCTLSSILGALGVFTFLVMPLVAFAVPAIVFGLVGARKADRDRRRIGRMGVVLGVLGLLLFAALWGPVLFL